MSKNVPLSYIFRALALAKQGKDRMDFPVFDTHYESEAYSTVSGQNGNNTVRVSNRFLESVENDAEWGLVARTDGHVMRKVRAR